MTRQEQQLDRDALRRWPLPDPSGGKNARGRVVVVGGSHRTPGAVLLAAEAAVRVGAGKPQIATVDSVAVQVSIALPEALVIPLRAAKDGEIDPGASEQVLELAADCDAILLGPGLLSPELACALLEQVVPHLSCPVVVDALGTAFLTEHPDGLSHLAGNAVLTPNDGELAHTLGRDVAVVREHLHESCVELAERTGAVVVSGGAETFVAAPGSATSWRLPGSVPGLGVAGSGDVKAGLVLGLLGRGVPPEGAGAWAAMVHQSAGAAAAETIAPLGFLAQELLPVIPRQITRLDPTTSSDSS